MGKFILIAITLFPFYCNSQTRGDYTWELGLSSYEGQDIYASSIEMNFNNDTLSIDTFYRPLFMEYLNASISDNQGKLLLYTNGCEVRNGNHNLIEGSKNLSPGVINDDWCVQGQGGYSVFEGGIFLPFNEDSIVDLFHQRLIILGQPLRLWGERSHLVAWQLTR